VSQVPVWVTIVGSLGIGAFIGNIVSHLLTSRLQRRNWLYDNKKLEWRQLIDELQECMELMGLAFRWKGAIESHAELAEERRKITRGMVRGGQIINNRIFIAEVLKRNDIQRKWVGLANLTKSNTEDLAAAGLKFVNAFNELHDEILRLARQDLGTAP
jgi:hypothetical protein